MSTNFVLKIYEELMRKIIQISCPSDEDSSSVYVLCNDGTVWKLKWDLIEQKEEWIELKKIPQDE